ncbi:uncharacterized protein BO96DRAFT_345022 [Aspergillus niger CBS 101883]|uniref:Contig An12c0010, genomic contig n=2 Tax=Aspergillus niger TaxID=5061 RepID=A2QY58_ASPNC|nr:uncharacterized protein BO96DRAFT_345022 [Aspergillus niger CBS 101883]XP_059601728.1 uncharacterized protein An12g00080 [Aspergillus niger]PYH53516.1 hypothetical protein BO96DRAFT_345022 [Aspergillus niger CBS 101883]CAK40938.1 unnamed protein product [Aspergillus niger]
MNPCQATTCRLPINLNRYIGTNEHHVPELVDVRFFTEEKIPKLHTTSCRLGDHLA